MAKERWIEIKARLGWEPRQKLSKDSQERVIFDVQYIKKHHSEVRSEVVFNHYQKPNQAKYEDPAGNKRNNVNLVP